MDEIDKILTVNPRISIENLGEFNTCVKNGLKDKKNKSLLRVYINLAAKFAECCGKEFFNYGKTLIHPLLSSLSDKQALVRCDVINALHKMESALGADFILNHIVVFLQNSENKDCQSVEMKQEILNWLLKNVALLAKFPNLKSIIPMFLGFLVDKNKEIRLLGDQLNEKIVILLGPALFSDSIKYLKSNMVLQIKPLFEKYCLAHKASAGGVNATTINATNTTSLITVEKDRVNPIAPCSINNEKEKQITEVQQINHAAAKENPAKAFKPNKFSRMEQEKVTPWPDDCILDELIEGLKEDIISSFTDAIGKKLFSFDLKRIQEGLSHLKQTASPSVLIENSDLVFKWVSFKLFNFASEDFIEELLDFLLMTLRTLQQSQTNLFEIEARIVLSSLRKISERNLPKYREKIDQVNFLVGLLWSPDYVNTFWGFSQQFSLPAPAMNPRVHFDQPIETENEAMKRTKARNSFAGHMTMEGLNNYSIMNESPSPMHSSNLTKKMILQNNLEVLNWSSIPGKIDALLNICNFLSEETNEYRRVIEEEATNIAKTISALFRPESTDNNQPVPEEFINYLVKISLKIFRNKFFLDNIAYDVLMELVENILHRLLIEDAAKTENKPQPNPSENHNKLGNDSPIKNLNSLMLKILETCSPNIIFQILFDLLIKHRRACVFSKFIALVIKCILKLTKVMEALLVNLDLNKLFLKFHLYVCECFNDNVKNNDDLGVKTIKTIINEIINIKGASVMDYYHIISTHEKQDKYIYRFLFGFFNFFQIYKIKKRGESNGFCVDGSKSCFPGNLATKTTQSRIEKPLHFP